MSTPEIESSAHDRLVVEAQLGRSPRGRWRVARRCHLGLPMAIETYPRLEDGTPFPTLFWLTCPLLIKRASRLESAGYMNELTDRLTTNDPFKERLRNAIARYSERRDTHEVITAAQPGGGPERVKCLHAHLAHELGDGPNPVGGLTLAATGWPDCVVACVRGAGSAGSRNEGGAGSAGSRNEGGAGSAGPQNEGGAGSAGPQEQEVDPE